MATKAAYKRLLKEYQAIQQQPPPFIHAKPTEKNILEWHYVITGPPDSPYVGGEYHGKVVFPSDYPFKPPSIMMITPNGRFKPATRLCLSMSDFHPEHWNPSWSVASILTGLVSFMLEDQSTTGSIITTHADKRMLAQRSWLYNRRENAKFAELFPERMALQPPEDLHIPESHTETVDETENVLAEEWRMVKQSGWAFYVVLAAFVLALSLLWR